MLCSTPLRIPIGYIACCYQFNPSVEQMSVFTESCRYIGSGAAAVPPVRRRDCALVMPGSISSNWHQERQRQQRLQHWLWRQPQLRLIGSFKRLGTQRIGLGVSRGGAESRPQQSINSEDCAFPSTSLSVRNGCFRIYSSTKSCTFCLNSFPQVMHEG